MKERRIFLAVIIILVLGIAGLGLFSYQQYCDLALLQGQRPNLEEAYLTLQNKYNALFQDYAALSTDYSSLRTGHDVLFGAYGTLLQEHTSLESKYGSFQPITPAEVFGQPRGWYRNSQYLSSEYLYEYFNLLSRYNYLESQYAALELQYHNLKELFDAVEEDYERLRDAVNQRSQHLDVSTFITPHDSAVCKVVAQITEGWRNPSDWTECWEDMAKMYHWIRDNIEYRQDGPYPVLPSNPSGDLRFSEDMWQFPNETLRLKTGDCEDLSILLCSMILCYTNEEYSCECILILSSTSGHMGVQIPVAEHRLVILDPTGNYYTQDWQGLTQQYVLIEINKWLEHLMPEMGSDLYVYRVFSNYVHKTFSSTLEYATWMYSR